MVILKVATTETRNDGDKRRYLMAHGVALFKAQTTSAN